MRVTKSIAKRIVFFGIVLVVVLLALWRIVTMTGNAGPTWHGITVGKSTGEQVIEEMGVPSEIEHDHNDDVHVYKGMLKWAAHKITVRENIVEEIKEDMSVYFPKEIKLTQFLDQYGAPDSVVWSQKDPTLRIALFPKTGVLVEATAGSLDDAQVTRAFYIRPTALAEIQKQFSDVISLANPFPNSDVVGPENPWASDLKTYNAKQ